MHFKSILLAFLLVTLLSLPYSTDASCRKLGRCCNGKNVDCKYVGGRFVKSRFIEQCFCDEFCVKSRDCCNDYRPFCLSQARDCEMSQWTAWSGCAARCNSGTQERRRQIRQLPSNGGKPCGKRIQRRGCYHNDERCPNYETAQLLPAYFSQHRNKEDYYQRPVVVDRIVRPSYCMHYRIDEMLWSCKYVSPYHVIKVGSEVCVECHDVAMGSNDKCKGAYTEPLQAYLGGYRWRATSGRPCYGKWTPIASLQKNCTCASKMGEDFIFV